MLRGLLRVFTSGLIIQPMVLLGIGFGIYMCVNYNLQEIFAWLAVPQLYALAVVIAFFYTFIFDRVYMGYSRKVNWRGTFDRFVGHFFKMILACLCAVSLFETLFF